MNLILFFAGRRTSVWSCPHFLVCGESVIFLRVGLVEREFILLNMTRKKKNPLNDITLQKRTVGKRDRGHFEAPQVLVIFLYFGVKLYDF